MVSNSRRDWMWSEACAMLERAERLHRDFFRPAGTQVAWEPPVDVLETEHEVLVFTALPGVDSQSVKAAIEDGILLIGGTRTLPPELRTAVIHRLELPQGHFLRQVRLPPGRYSGVHRATVNGCLLITLQKAGHGRG